MTLTTTLTVQPAAADSCCVHTCTGDVTPSSTPSRALARTAVRAPASGLFTFRGQRGGSPGRPASPVPLPETPVGADEANRPGARLGPVSGASPLRLARMPRPSGAETAQDTQHTRCEDVTVGGVPILGRVVELARRFGVDLDDVALAAREPEASWPGLNGVSEVRLRGDVAAIVPDDSFEVIAISTRRKALEGRSQPRHGAVKRGHSTMGRRHPTSVGDLLSAVEDAGLTVARDNRHVIIRHPDLPGQVTAAATPSDPRSIPNTVMQVRRTFGIDLRHGVPQSA